MGNRALVAAAVASLAARSVTAAAAPAAVTVRVDATTGKPISRFIYGLNFPEDARTWGAHVPAGITLSRFGGNRISAFNWETNASNCGNDCNGAFSNDGFLGGGTEVGEAVRARAAWAFAHGSAFLAPVPMLGWVAGDKDGPVSLRVPLVERRAKRFKVSKPRKGAPFAARPDTSDGFVYQDEYVAWLERTFPLAGADPARPIFYSLDNEPDLWGSTHEEARGDRRAGKKPVLTGYDELVRLTVEYASAIKDVAPHALVFGPVLSTWNGFANLYHNDEPDPAGRQFFLEYYLDALRRASAAQRRRLVDVLDVHWYAEATSSHNQSVANDWAEQDAAMIEARVQAPRSLWDRTYRERSWVSRAIGGPVRLIPRLRDLIAAHDPGMKIAITEYCYHRGGDISGAIAQADALGVFGREGVFAATMWPLSAQWAYQGDLDRAYACAFAAFRAYRDYDGRGGAFGDVSLATTTSDAERMGVYASADSTDASRLVLVAINRSDTALEADVTLAPIPSGGRVEAWRVTGGIAHCDGPSRVLPDVDIAGGSFRVRLPAFSVSTLVVRR